MKKYVGNYSSIFYIELNNLLDVAIVTFQASKTQFQGVPRRGARDPHAGVPRRHLRAAADRHGGRVQESAGPIDKNHES